MDKDMQKMLDRIKYNTEKKKRNTNLGNSDDVSKNSVTKSNALIRAYYRYGLVEKRIMETLVSMLHPLRSDNNFQEIELKAKTYADMFSVDLSSSYEQLEEAVSKLTKRVIIINNPEKGIDRIERPLMAEAVYIKKEGKIICTFNPKMVPHLVGMSNKFTKYPLVRAVDFKSSYTWRFYELMMSWAKPKHETNGLIAGWMTVNVSELRQMLGVPESYRWHNFQKQVLNILEREILEKANIYLGIERIKTGKKITDLKITFIENDQQNLPLEGGEIKDRKAA